MKFKLQFTVNIEYEADWFDEDLSPEEALKIDIETAKEHPLDWLGGTTTADVVNVTGVIVK